MSRWRGLFLTPSQESSQKGKGSAQHSWSPTQLGRLGLQLPAGNLTSVKDTYRKGWLVLRTFLSLVTPKRIRFSKRAGKKFSLLTA